MAKIINENNEVLFKGNIEEMQEAYEYLTISSHILAETKGLKMKDFYELNEKYWNDQVREAKELIFIQ